MLFKNGELMKKLLLIGLGLMMLMASFGYAADEPAKAPAPAQAPEATPAPREAGSVILGVTVIELTKVVKGWSVKNDVMGKSVFNDKNEKVGTVVDIIIDTDKVVTYAIIGAGGFLGIDKNDVAIPVKQFTVEGDKFILPGATKDAIKKMPPFNYAKKD
jgi:sporulation protein YlmC with PRC-barrel domain